MPNPIDNYEEFLKQLEEKFKNRFTSEDLEYCKAKSVYSNPPCVYPWRPFFSERGRRRYYK